jgi:multidrug transporter EmrE-like cation transporter
VVLTSNKQIFFGLNLVFNGIMWTLFTKALARGTSTTQVSILNTSSNFMITAVLGWMIFSESLPPLWFVGAALLVAGNVIIGRRDEGEEKGKGDEQVRAENGEGSYGSEDREGLLIGEGLDDLEDLEVERKRKEEEDMLQLEEEEEE